MNPFLRGLRYYKADAGRVALAFVLLLLSLGAGLLKPWPLALLVDHVLGNRPIPSWLSEYTHVWQLPTWIGALALGLFGIHATQALLGCAYQYCLIQSGLRGLARVRIEMFHWLQRLSLRFHQGTSQGDVIYRASWDTHSVHTLYQHGLFTLLASSLSVILMVIVMFRVNPPLTYTALVTVPFLFMAIQLLGGAMKRRCLAAHEADGKVTTQVQQSMAALPLIQSYTREAEAEKTFAAHVARALSLRQTQHAGELFYLAAVAVLLAAGTALTLWVGANEVAAGRLTVGELLVFIAYLGQFYEPLNQLAHVGQTIADASAGIQRVFEILDTPAEVAELPHARPVMGPSVKVSVSEGHKANSPSSTQPLVARGNIELHNVSYSYQPERWALEGINLQIQAGESVAIIGPSGAGKTTLLHLFPRFFDPEKGRITLEGDDIKHLVIKDLRRQMALVMQEPILLPGTILENISFGRPGARFDEIEAAAQAAHADEFIKRLPHHYETVIGEGAARLSTGEMQRISLARAFLKNAPILLLDEPTSSLDTENEQLIMDGLSTLMSHRTVIMVTHRPALCRLAKEIVVMDQGHVVGRGTLSELMAKPGYASRFLRA